MGCVNRALLAQALADDTMMVEADVSLTTNNQPIMAHPPNKTSDLSLMEFLDTVLNATEAGAKKGIKLDFKDKDAVSKAITILEGLRHRIKIPLWFNADILLGPGGGG